ncbi:patatin-like phospholipase family protein [Hydrogenophaga sp.]|uniref:patatin-like phospholipase family protein n=1 Tax=Hydrogenophaga sp. TaxID=1904254 RepID=UPI0035B3E5C7
MARPSTRSPAPKRRLDLALQGGGSHGAFTWGVLDRLLEEEWLEIAGVSGTSAGAMNAVALAAGLMEGGRTGAQAALRRFWERVAEASPFALLQGGPMAPWFGPSSPWIQAWTAPWQNSLQAFASQLSPYQFNPLNLNPLRDILEDTIDFARVRGCHRTQLFIAATRVSTGELRVFRQSELTADMVMASACLPLLFQAVQIEGEAYWDGGYAGNPTLLPLISDTDADDLLLVPINPSRRNEVPTLAGDILDRANEVTFNASLIKELRTIALIKDLLRDAGRPDSAYRQPLFRRVDDLRLHRLDTDAALAPFGASTKLQTDRAFLLRLHAIGRQVADEWLSANASAIGRRPTVSLDAAWPGA